MAIMHARLVHVPAPGSGHDGGRVFSRAMHSALIDEALVSLPSRQKLCFGLRNHLSDPPDL